MDETDLAQRAARGDGQAFTELVRLHQVSVYNTALRMCGDEAEAEDALQETFLRAFRALHRFDPTRPPGPWLRRIAVNVCLNRLARRASAPLADEDSLPADGPDPEAQAIGRDESRRVRRALLKLPPRYRAAIELRHFQELSYAEMAASLGRPVSDVKSDLFRARRLLAGYLKGEEPR